MLSGRAGAGGVRAALHSSPLRSSVRGAVTGALDPPARLGPCRLRRTKFKPGRKLSAWFDTRSRNDNDRRAFAVVWHSVCEPYGGLTDAEAALTAEAGCRGLRSPFRALTATDGHMRVLIAPLDTTFPQLVRLSDPRYAADLVGDRIGLRVDTVRYRPGQRHVLRYRPEGGAGPVLFAKLYRDDGAADRARVATAVAGLFEPGDGYAVACPAAYVEDDRVLLVPRVKGHPLSAHLRRGARDLGPLVAGAGAMLRRLHDAPPDLAARAEPRDVGAELTETGRAAAAIERLLPAAHIVVQDVLACTRELLDRTPAETPRFVHGDFKSDHILVGHRTLTLIDFDRCARADPALDLAKFLADVRWWCGRPRQETVRRAQQEFLRGYGPMPAPRLARARALEALLLVKLTARRVPVHAPDWERRTSELVDAAWRILREAPPAGRKGHHGVSAKSARASAR
jgi:aminoglycoside phosphotransferase (APT) family kinase protein